MQEAWLRTNCIAIQWTVLWMRQGSAVLQYSHCSGDTASRRWAGRTGAGLGVQARRRASGHWALGRWVGRESEHARRARQADAGQGRRRGARQAGTRCRRAARTRRGSRSAGGQAVARAADAAGVGARGARCGRAYARRLGVLAGSTGPS